MTTHYRKPDGSTWCNSKAKVARTTGAPDSVECPRCRRAAGLGKYDALEALSGIIKLSTYGTHHSPKC